MRPLLPCLALSMLLTGCFDMDHQPRYDHYEKSSLFPNGQSLQAPPDGTVSRDEAQREEVLQTRPQMSAALLKRGEERYGIYCVPCHDPSGAGNGEIVSRGFPHPPSFHSQRLRDASSRYIVDVITHGHGVMYSYADRVSPKDRWAIAAYIRALQFSQHAPAANLAPEDKTKLADAKS